MKKTINILFVIIALLAIFEFLFVSGMFTGPAMMVCVLIISIINAAYAAAHHLYNETILYIIAGIALCMGYVKMIF